MVTLARLRARLLGYDETDISDEVLTELLDTAKNDYGLTEGIDDATIIDLTVAVAYRALATQAARNFKYAQGSEKVDKTEEAKRLQGLYEAAWAALPESVRTQGEPDPDVFTFGPTEVTDE